MGKYYDLIMEPTENSFTSYFNKYWHNKLDTLDKPYANALQLRIGNQLRPKLTCWGAAFNSTNPHEIDLIRVAEIATYIEMLHKASIIIDDMLDNDNARHEQKTFHVEFGQEKAIIFALVLLSKGTAGIITSYKGSKFYDKSVMLFSDTIYSMARGGLAELELNHVSRFDIKKIQKIINLQTISLIKNSFLLGYWSTCKKYNNEAEEQIATIGSNCGYIFQVLNDLEPFAAVKKNSAYKGNINIDVDRDRKNIVVAYIFGATSKKEQQMLYSSKGDNLTTLLMSLYQKYSVYDEINSSVRELVNQTQKLIGEMGKHNKQTSYITDFSKFVDEMVDICFSKLV